ncbi:HXXEE domain-containing protein [Clostridium ragsdalei]|nr:HXXEE domain-containing protein [Clostridium ragsdalei]
MFPIIFMLHDFEEIFMTEVWAKRYKKEIDMAWPKRQPFGLDYMHFYQSPTIALGIYFEFILYLLISLLSAVFKSYFIWYSTFLGVTLHLLLIHIIIGSFKFKHYVPGVITSIIFLLPSIYYLYVSGKMLHYTGTTVILAFLLGIALLIALLPILHKSMGPCSNWFHKYSKAR